MVGKEWNLTDKRKEEAIRLLKGQYNINLLAAHFNICRDTLWKKLKKAGINAKELQQDGIRVLRADLYSDLANIEDVKDRAKLTLDTLKHYDKSDDVAKDEVTVKYASMDDFYKDSK